MRIDEQFTPEAVLEELGRRVARRRLDLGITQADAAARAGVGKRTLERIEAGADVRLSTLVHLLQVLGLGDGLELLVPDSGPRPMELLERKGNSRKRASTRRPSKPKRGWQWGDEG